MTDERDEIRARIDIVELVSARVPLRRAGKVFKGLCPFHNDRNPSFTVDPATGRYRCWSCGEAGDCFTWVMKTANIEFVDALKELADKAGVTLSSRKDAPPPGLRDAHRAAMAEALVFFRDQLTKNPKALQYLQQRGIPQEVAEEWELGYAPEVGEALATVLRRQGHNLAECKNLFLIDQDSRGGYFDKFRGRLMFPIRDERGQLVAFGGRLLGDGQPKYINSSDTPLYRKSRVLYGFDRSKDTISKEKLAILVEGYLDVIACHRAGVTNAVASLGTALSEEQAKLLKRWCDDVTILYDADDAGRKAAERGTGLLQAESVRVRVALLPAGEDPDTLLRHQGPAAVRQVTGRSVTPLEFAISQLEAKTRPDEPAFWERLVEIMVAHPEDLEADLTLNRLAALYPGTKDPSSSRRRLDAMIAAKRRGNQPESKRNPRATRPTEHRALSEPMLSAEFYIFRALQEPEFRHPAWLFSRVLDLFETGTAIAMSQAISAAFPTQPPEGPLSGWLGKLPEEQQRIMEALRQDFRSENVDELHLTDSVEFLRRRSAKRALQKMRRGELTAEERLQIHLRLKAMTRDKEVASSNEDDDPFA